jgi:hypothetical protein
MLNKKLLGSASSPPSDPDFADVTLLLNGDGTNGAQNNTFLDSSTNNFTITRNGNVTQGSFSPYTAAAPYSTATKGGSGYFDGSGDDITAASNAAFNQSGDFTIEYWAYLNANTNYQIIFGRGSDYITIQHSSDSGAMIRIVRYGAALIDTGGDVTAGQWNHFALVRSGSTVTAYLNGVSVASGTDSTSTAPGNALSIGQLGGGNDYFTGYLSDVRFTNTAVYTTAFTPPTAPLTAISGTAFLAKFTNAGIPDLAMINNLETVGNAQVSTSVKKYGTGSISFDGNGDFLSYPSSVFGSGDFTVECWVYFNSTSGDQTIFGINWNSNANSLSAVRVDISSGVFRYMGSTDGTNFYFFQATSTSPSTSTWYHIALVRSSGTVTFYVDGTSVNSTSSVPNALYAGTGGSRIGNILYSENNYLNGYVDDFRITNVDRYTANFTPPTKALETF